jgi:hypothetical protein
MGPISAFLTAIVILGVVGLGIMLGGSFTFLITGTIEFMLIRQLSRLTGAVEDKRYFPPPQPLHELSPASANNLAQPVGSVTENTTRTLEYARHEQSRS